VSEGRLYVGFTGPSIFLGDHLPVEIRDAKNQLVTRTQGHVDLPLPAGLYVVDATLPGGKHHSEVVQVIADTPTSVVLGGDEGAEMDVFVSAAGTEPISSQPEDAPAVVLLDHQACVPSDQSGAKWKFEPEPGAMLMEAPWARFGIARTTVTASLPLNPAGEPERTGCAVRFVRRGERTRVDVSFVRKRRVASTLEGLVKSADVVSTGTLFSNAEDVLFYKYRDPAAAALGALTLHRIGRLPEHAGWVENLARDFRWIADGRVVLAALLANNADRAERERGLAELLSAAPQRPLFADGFALLLQLLRSWPDESSAEVRRAALSALPVDPATVDWSAMALTNYDDD
jgi:hypothetical protein